MTAAPDLFTYLDALDEEAKRPAWAPSKRQRVRIRHRDYERLEPVALQLAETSGANGFTADDLRSAATDAGIITGAEGQGKDADRQRALSWFGPFLASLAKQGKIAAIRYSDGNPVKRASTRKAANGNSQITYVHPRHARTIT